MTDKFQFAATYPAYGHLKVSFDSDLGELVSDCLWAEERGEQGSTSYCRETYEPATDADSPVEYLYRAAFGGDRGTLHVWRQDGTDEWTTTFQTGHAWFSPTREVRWPTARAALNGALAEGVVLAESDPGEWVYNEPWVEFLRTRSEGGRVTGRPVVYVAGPYSQGDPVENVGAAVHLASMLMDRGWAWPLVPHLTHLWHLIAPRPYQDWIHLDLALLARCDGLVRLPGASAGADAEVAWCDEHGVPVHRLPLAWGSTTALARLRSWLDEVEEVIHAR